jgi:hypothetical protein
MDRWVRNVTMATAKASSRRGFLASMARGLVGAGLGASFLFGGQRFAFANSCTTLTVGPGCGTNPCPSGDGDGCSFSSSECAFYGLSCGASAACPSGCNEDAHWSCCCNHAVYHCRDCSSCPGSVSCHCEGAGNASC